LVVAGDFSSEYPPHEACPDLCCLGAVRSFADFQVLSSVTTADDHQGVGGAFVVETHFELYHPSGFLLSVALFRQSQKR